MQYLCVFITAPKGLLKKVKLLNWQSWSQGLYNDVGGRNIVMVTTTENELQSNIALVPPIRVLDKFQKNGLRLGLKRKFNRTTNKYNVSGKVSYTKDQATLVSSLKDKRKYDSSGAQVSSTPRALIDDDVLQLAGWEKRDYTN